jgi:Tol biopolymer transport system component
MRTAQTRAVVAGLILTFTGVACSDSTGVDAALNRKILFIGQSDPFFGQAFIYAVQPNGNGLVKITEGLGQAFYPRWSRDGKQIAYSTGVQSAAQVWVMNANGSNPHAISDPNYSCAGYIRLTWSPTGDRILADCELLEQFVIDVVHGTSYSLTQLWGDIAGTPDWSPVEDKILFLRASNAQVANLDGTGAVTVATAAFQPQWSPDGTQITFARRNDVQSTVIFVANADGSNARQITFPADASVADGPSSWSPDGKHIVYVREESKVGPLGTSRLHVIDPDGHNDVTITPDTLWALRPDW